MDFLQRNLRRLRIRRLERRTAVIKEGDLDKSGRVLHGRNKRRTRKKANSYENVDLSTSGYDTSEYRTTWDEFEHENIYGVDPFKSTRPTETEGKTSKLPPSLRKFLSEYRTEHDYNYKLEPILTDYSSSVSSLKSDDLICAKVPLYDDSYKTLNRSPKKKLLHNDIEEYFSLEACAKICKEVSKQSYQNVSCQDPVLTNWDDAITSMTTPSCEKTLNHEGGFLQIPDSDITLIVPYGAIPLGQTQKIKISAIYNPQFTRAGDMDAPRLTPVVKFEPTGLQFQVPAQLILPHCGAFHDIKKCSFDVYFSQHKEGEREKWNLDTSGLASRLTESTCFLFVPHFTFEDVMISGEGVRKKLRFFPIVQYIADETTDEITVALWYCDDDDTVYKQIEESEKKLGSCVVGTYETLAVDSNTTILLTAAKGPGKTNWNLEGSIKVRITQHKLWTVNARGSKKFLFRRDSKDGTPSALKHWLYAGPPDQATDIEFYLNMDITTMMSRQTKKIDNYPSATEVFTMPEGAYASEFCSMEVKQPSPVPTQSKNAICNIKPDVVKKKKITTFSHKSSALLCQGWLHAPSVRQETKSDVTLSCQELLYTTPIEQGTQSDVTQFQECKEADIIMRQENVRLCRKFERNMIMPQRALDFHLRRKLQILLDPIHHRSGLSDWRDLASSLGFDGMIEYIQGTVKESPTQCILYMAMVNEKIHQPSDLIPILNGIKRSDAAKVVKDHEREKQNAISNSESDSTSSGSTRPIAYGSASSSQILSMTSTEDSDYMSDNIP